ncbi:MAG: ParB N-terminal domain-containing protein [Pseudolabrys sp.]
MDAITPTTTDDQNQQEQPRSWRDVLPIHPAAELLPLMSADELRELADDIEKNGLQEKVDITEQDGVLMLLDGRNRLDALQLLGREIIVSQHDYSAMRLGGRRMSNRKQAAALAAAKNRHIPSSEFCEWAFPENPFAFVLSKNIHRRHLTPEQKRPATIELVKRSAELSNALLAEMADVDDHEIADIRAELESTSEIPRFEKTIGRDGKARPAKQFRSRAGCTGVAELLSRRDDEAPESSDVEQLPTPVEMAPLTPTDYDITELIYVWGEVVAQGKAKNQTRLREAIVALRTECNRALAASHISLTPDKGLH